MKILLLALTLLLSAAAPASAANLAVTAANLETMQDADDYARAWIANYRAESPSLDTPVVILHVGNELPEQLKWVLVHLERARIPFELKLLTHGEVQNALNDARDGAAELIKYDLAAPQKARGAWKRASLMARRIFGLPNGITFWVKIKSPARQKWLEAGSAAFQAVQAGASLSASLYLVQKTGVPLHIAPAAGLLMTWVWANIYKMRPIVEVMTQGRVTKEVRPGEFKVENSRLFFYATSALRNFVLNGLIVGAAFGWDQVLTSQSLHTNVENTALSLVAGSWVEQYINSKQAKSGPDGQTLVEKGKWSPIKTVVINTVWNTFYYGIVRNLHLLNYGSYGKWTYYAMAAVGTVYTVYQERFWFAGKARQLLRALGVLRKQRCETLILKP